MAGWPGGALRLVQTRHRGEGPSRAVQASGAGIARAELVRTRDVGEAREVFSRVYAGATLEPMRDAPFACALEVVSFGATRVVKGDWTGGGQASLPDLGEHYVLSLSAGGVSAGDHAGEPFRVVPGRRGALFSPGRSCVLDVDAEFHGRTLVIDRGALDAHFTTLTGNALRGPICFEVSLDLEDGPGRTVHEVAELFRREIEQPWASPMLLTTLRGALFTSLLVHTRHNQSALLDAPLPRVAPACVRKAEEYMAAHAAEPITLADVVAAAGAPERSLRAAFVACRGMPPMDFLRRRRFELARGHLAEPSADTSVAGVVAALGLGHPGRFSIEYKVRFGESPSETLSAGRAAAGLPRLQPRRRAFMAR
ncbi:AraC family transcriptional regulator [Polyangium fumosum]|uniref:AraC family transcriptional regulator n=1 Tax=Polyangium fumosum TaxID=889272 RepID=A0A4U1JI89_9BACT|nr:AraC family transcriptional regulator [Polyangium fumosum]TKD12358.1 AraC family transcriptional regulator [Polyangium fumosum]